MKEKREKRIDIPGEEETLSDHRALIWSLVPSCSEPKRYGISESSESVSTTQQQVGRLVLYAS
jgi:hypothetical protein